MSSSSIVLVPSLPHPLKYAREYARSKVRVCVRVQGQGQGSGFRVRVRVQGQGSGFRFRVQGQVQGQGQGQALGLRGWGGEGLYHRVRPSTHFPIAPHLLVEVDALEY